MSIEALRGSSEGLPRIPRSPLAPARLSATHAAQLGCESQYPLDPPPCDGDCHAIRRPGCEEDDPLDRVLQCEREASLRPARCEAACGAELSYPRVLPGDALSCIEGQARLASGCADERVELAARLDPLRGPRLHACLQSAAACGGVDECDEACSESPADCRRQYELQYRCLLGAEPPASCAPESQAGAALEEGEAPCCLEALSPLDCVDF